MSEISLQQIYDLALEVSRGVDRLESSVDEAMIEMQALKHEIGETRKLLFKFSQHWLKAPV